MSHSCRCCKEESDVKDDLEIVEVCIFNFLDTGACVIFGVGKGNASPMKLAVLYFWRKGKEPKTMKA